MTLPGNKLRDNSFMTPKNWKPTNEFRWIYTKTLRSVPCLQQKYESFLGNEETPPFRPKYAVEWRDVPTVTEE